MQTLQLVSQHRDTRAVHKFVHQTASVLYHGRYEIHGFVLIISLIHKFTFLTASLRQTFGKFGSIAALKVMVDKATGESKQIGFVRYRTSIISGKQSINSQLDTITKKMQLLR